MALKYKDVDKEVKDNQAIYKLAMDKGLNIAQARNQYYGQNDALTQAAAVATSKNTPRATNAPTVANYSPSYANNQTQQRTDPTYNQRGWLLAHLNGDKAGEAYYHAAEEANRAALGYSGGEDGSRYIPLMDNYGYFSFQSAPKWFDAYGNQINEQRDKVLNRKEFSYNPEEDALYQQLQAQYNREGDRAMKNTLGEISARTGGLASSYAGTAATQANQYYAQQLADRIPELQQLAYSMYMDDLNNDRADLSMLEGASDRDYGRFSDTYNRWAGDRDFAYGDFWNTKNFDEGVRQFNENMAIEREKLEDTIRMNNISIDQWNQADATQKAQWMISAGFVPSPELLDEAKISVENATSMANQIQSDRAFERQKAMASRTSGVSGEKENERLQEIDGSSATDDDGEAYTYEDLKADYKAAGKTLDMASIEKAMGRAATIEEFLAAEESGEIVEVKDGNTIRFEKKSNEQRNRGQNGLRFGYNGHR